MLASISLHQTLSLHPHTLTHNQPQELANVLAEADAAAAAAAAAHHAAEGQRHELELVHRELASTKAEAAAALDAATAAEEQVRWLPLVADLALVLL